jgi:pyruvate kinase
MPIAAWVTVPPHADFLEEVAAHPLVCGLRLNTVMPIAEPPAAVLDRLATLGRPVWVDLKGRQLRLVEAAVPPFTAVRLSHAVQVPTPTRAWFRDGTESARILAVDGDRLILDAGPRVVLGPGESVNVPHPDLRVSGTLTPSDRAWLAALADRPQADRKVLLSFAESDDDLAEVHAACPRAEVVAKIESRRGLAWFESARCRVMAARGDLYVELPAPHHVVGALRRIARRPDAVAASRIASSLLRSPVPSSADVGDIGFLLLLGFRTLLLGDEVCLSRDTAIGALELVRSVAAELDLYPPGW